MVVSKAVAVRVLQGLGFKSADGWIDERLRKKLGMLHEMVEDDTAIGDKDLDNVLDELIAAGRENEEIEFSEDLPPAKEPEELAEPDADESEPEPEPVEKPVKKERKKREPKVERATNGRQRNVDHRKTRAGVAAILLKSRGLDVELDSLADEVDAEYVRVTGHKSNRDCAITYLGIARCAIKSYLEG